MIKDFFRFSLLVLIGSSFCLFGQTPEVSQSKKLEAFKTDSFLKVPNGLVEAVLDSFLADIYRRNDGARGVVVNFGSIREISERKRFITNYINFRKFDASLLSFVIGGNVSEWRTDLWIVPKGADPPKLEPEAYIAAEFGTGTKAKALQIFRNFYRELANNPNSRGYIINYGTNAQIALRERWFTENINFRHFDRSRITLVRGGKIGGLRTVMWIIPPGADNPVP